MIIDDSDWIIHEPLDWSTDGKKILFTKTLEIRNGLAHRVPAYVEVQDYGPHIIPNVDLNCSNNLKWSPNGEIVVYQDKMCGRGMNSGFMGLVSLDGYNEKLIPKEDSTSYPRAFVISPDGSAIVYITNTITSNEVILPSVIESAVIYKMTLAKPISEFETITMMTLVFWNLYHVDDFQIEWSLSHLPTSGHSFL